MNINSIADTLCAMTFNGYVEIFGTLIGLVYLYLQYKARPLFWHVAIINAIPFVYLFLLKGNYASAALFTYYLIVGVKMVFFTPKDENEGSGNVFTITNIPSRLYPRLLLTVTVICGTLYFFLLNVEQIITALNGMFNFNLPVATPRTPLADAFATSLSFVGMWLLSKKYLEQWILWVVVNTVFVYMQIVSDLYQWAALFTVYGIVAVMGYFNWRKLQRAQQPSAVSA